MYEKCINRISTFDNMLQNRWILVSERDGVKVKDGVKVIRCGVCVSGGFVRKYHNEIDDSIVRVLGMIYRLEFSYI